MTSPGSTSFGSHQYVYENLDFGKKQVSLQLQCDDGKAIISKLALNMQMLKALDISGLQV